MRILLNLGIAFLLLVSFATGYIEVQHEVVPYDFELFKEGEKPKNIILVIGDGMGVNHIKAARIVSVGIDGKLNMEKLPIISFITTYSANSSVPDSAAAATAIACGYKTNNGMVGMLPDGEKVMSILEAAKSIGKATGLVTTDKVTGATPAAFVTHTNSRNNFKEIAEQLLEGNKVNVILGGEELFFLPKSLGGKRTDERNLIEEAKEAGYRFVNTVEDLLSVPVEETRYLLGLFPVKRCQDRKPSLAEMTDIAIRILSQEEKGFFLMMEGAQIDWTSHANNTEQTIRETIDLDKAVKVILEFAKNDKKTLVVITADHETGGMKVKGDSPEDLKISWSTTHHTDQKVPVFSYGPGAELFADIEDNTEISKKFAKLFGIKRFPRYLR